MPTPSLDEPAGETLGKALRRLRQERGLGTRELARLAGTSKRSIQDWETDRYVPAGAALDRVLAALTPPTGLRARLLAAAAPVYARIALAGSTLGAPVHVGEVLRAMRRRQGTTQADVARAAGVSQATLARWESGDTIPTAEALQRATFALGASPEEVIALLAVERREEPADDARRCLQYASTAPLALRDVLLLGLESTLWWRATIDPSAERALCHTIATRAHQCLLRGAIDEVDGHVRRALRLVHRDERSPVAASAVYAGAWTAQRTPGREARAVRSLGKWSERMDDPQTRQWLRSAQGFAMIRAGDAEGGIAQLERLERESREPGVVNDFFLTNLVEAFLLTNRPERAAEALAAMDGRSGPLPVAKTLLACGEEPSSEALDAARRFGATSWGAGQEAAQIERGVDRVRRGGVARFG